MQAVAVAISDSGTVTANQITELEIEWVGSITIQSGDTAEIQFSETNGEEEPMTWRQAISWRFTLPKTRCLLSMELKNAERS